MKAALVIYMYIHACLSSITRDALGVALLTNYFKTCLWAQVIFSR
jgi:hypothetical protein